MELVEILKTLRRHRLAVVFVLLVAAAVATLTTYRVRVSPLGLESRALTTGAATSQILVDSPQSALADLKQDTVPLTTRAGVFAQFMASTGVKDAIAQAAGIPADRVTTEGPFSGAGAGQNVVTPAEARGSQVLAENKRYRLVFVAQQDLPLVTIYAQAPTPREAARLADGAYTGVRAYLDRLQTANELAPARRVIIRSLGPAQAGPVTSGGSKAVAALAFVALLTLGLLAILGLARVRRALAESEPAQGAEVVLTPADLAARDDDAAPRRVHGAAS